MADNKKYYYLKLKDNFFETDSMVVLESMPDGHLYSNILLKLYLRSLKNEGRLMFNNRIPYNSTILAQITRHSVGVVEKALQLFRDLELIEVLDNGAIYMLDIQNFIGESSTEADRKRSYRKQIEAEKTKGQMSGQISDKNPPEIEIDKDIDIELEIDIDIKKIIKTWNSLNLTQISTMNDIRSKNIKSIREEYGAKNILKAIKNINKSSYLKGEGKEGKAIEFDWFILPKNFIKVLEGNYTDRKGKKGNMKFDNFTGRDYDYDDLEKKLLGWDKDDEDE